MRIFKFLKSQPAGVLALVDPNGNPHATVIYFSVDDNFMITFVTKRDTKKSDTIQHNNHVMLVAYDPKSQTTAQITGFATDISETHRAQQAFRDTMLAAEQTSESGMPPISKLNAGHYVGYQIKPAQIRMAVFAGPDLFETIDFN